MLRFHFCLFWKSIKIYQRYKQTNCFFFFFFLQYSYCRVQDFIYVLYNESDSFHFPSDVSWYCWGHCVLVCVCVCVCKCVCVCVDQCARWQVLSVVGCDPGVMKKPCPLITAAWFTTPADPPHHTALSTALILLVSSDNSSHSPAKQTQTHIRSNK